MGSPLFNTLVTSVVPGEGAFPGENSLAAILSSSQDNLTPLATGANPGTLVLGLQNRYTVVNNGGGVVSAIPHSGNAGTSYVVGDLVYVTQSGAVAGTLTVAAINPSTGAVTALTFLYRGTGYTTATGLSTTTNSAAGSGLEVDIVAGADSISLPVSIAGMTITIKNASSSSAIVKAIPHSGNAGSGYKVGDVITVTQTGGSGGTFVVAAITGGSSTGPVGSLSPVTAGTGYATATALSTTGGTGTGLEVDITTGGNALAIYPATGDAIASLGANAAYNLSQGNDVTLSCYTAGTWRYNTARPFETNDAYNTNSAVTSATLTAANITGGATEVTLNLTGTLTGASNATLPTVANLIAAISPTAVAGQTYKLRIINSSSGNFAWTVVTNTGWTLTGTMSVADNTWRDFYVTITSGTTATLQSVGTGTNS
jgi:hypothetical protein